MNFAVYGKESCPHCINAVELLKEKEIEHAYIDLDKDAEALKFIKSEGHRRIPVIFSINESEGQSEWTLVGGFSELCKFLNEKGL